MSPDLRPALSASGVADPAPLGVTIQPINVLGRRRRRLRHACGDLMHGVDVIARRCTESHSSGAISSPILRVFCQKTAEISFRFMPIFGESNPPRFSTKREAGRFIFSTQLASHTHGSSGKGRDQTRYASFLFLPAGASGVHEALEPGRQMNSFGGAGSAECSEVGKYRCRSNICFFG